MGTYFVSSDNDEYTYLTNDDKEMTIYCNGDNLIKKPGYEVLITDIDDVYFEIDDTLVYITVKRDDYDYRFLLAYMHELEEVNEEE